MTSPVVDDIPMLHQELPGQQRTLWVTSYSVQDHRKALWWDDLALKGILKISTEKSRGHHSGGWRRQRQGWDSRINPGFNIIKIRRSYLYNGNSNGKSIEVVKIFWYSPMMIMIVINGDDDDDDDEGEEEEEDGEDEDDEEDEDDDEEEEGRKRGRRRRRRNRTSIEVIRWWWGWWWWRRRRRRRWGWGSGGWGGQRRR